MSVDLGAIRWSIDAGERSELNNIGYITCRLWPFKAQRVFLLRGLCMAGGGSRACRGNKPRGAAGSASVN